jgi:hypothetical protein
MSYVELVFETVVRKTRQSTCDCIGSSVMALDVEVLGTLYMENKAGYACLILPSSLSHCKLVSWLVRSNSWESSRVFPKI